MKPRKEIEESLSRNSSMIMNNPDTVAICDAIRISTRLLLDIREILVKNSEPTKKERLQNTRIISSNEVVNEFFEKLIKKAEEKIKK